jgi:hypothetical protein
MLLKRTLLLIGYYLASTLIIIATGMAGHGFTSPATVFYSWAYFLIVLVPSSYFPLAAYLVFLLGLSLLSRFIAGLGFRHCLKIPAGLYLLGGVISSIAQGGFRREPFLPYSILFLFSGLFVTLYMILDWRLIKQASSRTASPSRSGAD